MSGRSNFSSGLAINVAPCAPASAGSGSRHYSVVMTTDEFECPFCGEPGEIAADYDPDATGDQVFVQDCAVCCRPWTVTVHVGADGEVSFDVQRS